MKMMNKTLLAAGVALSALTVASTANAAPILVNFSFTGSSTYPGTVTGQLQFSSAGTGVAATSARVLTSTSAQAVADPTLNWVTGSDYVNSNRFDVSSAGVITAASFYAGFYNGTTLLLNGFAGLNNFQTSYSVSNSDGFAGVTYTPVASAAAVPEPASWAMMILGIGAIGFALRRRTVATRVSYAA
jgi:hypothetical protein